MLIYTNKKEPKWTILELSLNVLVNAIVLMMASNIFKGFYVGGFGYAVITALIIMLLNYTVKPFIKLLTMPLTIFTLGLSYPLINVIILKFASVGKSRKKSLVRQTTASTWCSYESGRPSHGRW